MFDPTNRRMGLALSGGGFRATLFNLGGLWRLNDAGWLEHITRITSVSGGSITAGILARAWSELEFDQGKAKNFERLIVEPTRGFCSNTIDIKGGLIGMMNPFKSIGEQMASIYDDMLFDGMTLQDLPEVGSGPLFIFYATNLQTGVSFRFSRPYMADYLLGTYTTPLIPMAQVLAASAGFPPVLSPVKLVTDPGQWREGSTDLPLEQLRKRVILTDGGVYDNMGLEALWNHKEIDVVLASDAGGPFTVKTSQRSFWLSQLPRVRNILIEQTRALRKRMLVGQYQSGHKAGSLWTIQTEISDYDLPDPLMNDTAQTGQLRNVRTRLNRFSDDEQTQLINWGYALADAAIRKWVDPDQPLGVLPYG